MSLKFLGIDVGSTTVKLALLDEDRKLIHARYERHHTEVRQTARKLFAEAAELFPGDELCCAFTGSGGLLLSQWLELDFVQEVIASKEAVEHLIPQTDVVIELGGEDAKIIYFDQGIEQRMNGTCAGGTGAFIDQMASLLHTDASGLNELAKGQERIYPIASRCGVFAKTDVQPLLNEGARQEDIAASIFQSVVTQTISGLACGRPIRGKVAFLGGPLQYLSQLRKRFQISLKLEDEDMIIPKEAHLFVAMGAALRACRASHAKTLCFADLLARLDALGDHQGDEVSRLDPLFASEKDYQDFVSRHQKEKVCRADLASYNKKLAYLGIDAGSTTLKAALVGEGGELLYTFYDSNKGEVFEAAKKLILDLYEKLPKGLQIAHTTCTGYGEALLLEALGADTGEIETVAHLRAAQEVLPNVEFILDVGGQDMKCLRIKDGVIEHIMLNEACSSGCGSFISSFADSMGMSVQDFAQAALHADKPVDLGSRCTVFMNSRVKQAQKEGATVGDISAGLSYSVMKNALFKVIKLRDASEIGEGLIVQGGTFLNDAVLRAFELLTGKEAYRPDIAGCMGAYGAALLARDRAQAAGQEISGLLSAASLSALEVSVKQTRCGCCSNSCLLTINEFELAEDRAQVFKEKAPKKRRFITGNRCERGAGVQRMHSQAPNIYAYKQRRLFSYSQDPKRSYRASVGIPRALNMYENYPFWFTFFDALDFEVKVSAPSSKKLYELGIESMPSESVCYPAKLSHGHVMDLLAQEPTYIWMPCIKWERKEDEGAGNSYTCPVVMSYPEALALNIDELETASSTFLHPFVPYHDKDELARRMFELLQESFAPHANDITYSQVELALQAAWEEDERFKRDIQKAGESCLRWLEENKGHGIVLAGRPYHNDPEINHALPDLIASFGFAVLTEDSVSHLCESDRPIRVVDQWMYHSRLYRAAKFVASRADLDLVQLNSFGCGLDALTTDQVQEILELNNKIYTVLKIDEVSNLGAARIRIRSLMAALADKSVTALGTGTQIAGTQATGAQAAGTQLQRQATFQQTTPVSAAFKKVRFTKKMKEEGYTILSPQMAPIHFDLLSEIFKAEGYNFVLLPSVDKGALDAGLRFVNNDICYPSILVTGQIMEAVTSGLYDMDKTAVIISQTGGACRATNYIALIRKALKDAGYPQVPVIALGPGGLDEKNEGFKFTLPMLKRASYAVLYGDVIMQCLYRTRPYELEKGSAEALYEQCMEMARKQVGCLNRKSFTALCKKTVEAFDALPLTPQRNRPRVGVVGEILVKFHPTANNDLIQTIEREGCEAVVPGLADFFLYSMSGAANWVEELGSSKGAQLRSRALIGLLEWMRKPADKILASSKRFEPSVSIFELAKKAKELLSLCNSAGEGWLLTAEMLELIESGTPNIVCAQPFACLPNHVVGKAVIKELRRRHPASNIVAVDYDPGASEVNQLNRIKLMIAVAQEAHAQGKEFKIDAGTDDVCGNEVPIDLAELKVCACSGPCGSSHASICECSCGCNSSVQAGVTQHEEGLAMLSDPSLKRKGRRKDESDKEGDYEEDLRASSY